jgi:ribosomal protein S18 acetylase RimI-like enzyme
MLGAYYRKARAGLLVYYPTLNWIMCLVVDKPYRQKSIATALLQQLKNQLEGKITVIKMLNVDHTDSGMFQFLQRFGFKLYVKQFEMKLTL